MPRRGMIMAAALVGLAALADGPATFGQAEPPVAQPKRSRHWFQLLHRLSR